MISQLEERIAILVSAMSSVRLRIRQRTRHLFRRTWTSKDREEYREDMSNVMEPEGIHYSASLRPEGVPFSGCRYMKG